MLKLTWGKTLPPSISIVKVMGQILLFIFVKQVAKGKTLSFYCFYTISNSQSTDDKAPSFLSIESKYFSLYLKTVEFLWFANKLLSLHNLYRCEEECCVWVPFFSHVCICSLLSYTEWCKIPWHYRWCVQRHVKWFAAHVMQSYKSVKTCVFSYVTNCIHLLSCYFCFQYFFVKSTLIVSWSVIWELLSFDR